MLKRTLTGIVILIVLALAVASRLLTTWIFDIFALILIELSIFEMQSAYGLYGKKPYRIFNFLYPIIAFLCFRFAPTILHAIFIQMIALLVVFLICILLDVIEAKQFSKNVISGKITEKTANICISNRTFATFQIILYPSILLSFLFAINNMELNLGFICLIVAFAVTMFSDVFAYFFGVLIKSRKIYPLISPKKSLAGLIGGTFGGILASGLALWAFYYGGLLPSIITTLSPASAIILFALIGLVGTFLAQFGDLLASIIKRKVGIKDYGNVFPGHGGFMDRVDGLMFVVPFTYILVMLFIL
ncbi:MAG: phosphatidate cytidylyltransferase [Clostridia bacterium]